MNAKQKPVFDKKKVVIRFDKKNNNMLEKEHR